MPLTLQDQTLIKAEIRSVIRETKQNLTKGLGNYFAEINTSAKHQEHTQLLLKIAERMFASKTAPITSQQLSLYHQHVSRVLKTTILANLIDIVMGDGKTLLQLFPRIYFHDMKNYVKSRYVDRNSIENHGQLFLKTKITDEHLNKLLTEVRTNMPGIVSEILTYGSPDEVKRKFEINNIQFKAYEIYTLTHRFGIKMGFGLDHNIKIPVVKNGNKIGTLAFNPDDALSREYGYIWTQQLLSGFIQEAVDTSEMQLRDDLLKIIRSYQLALSPGTQSFKKNTQYPRFKSRKQSGEELTYKDCDFELFTAYNDGKPIIFSGGWDGKTEGHAIGLGVYKNYLIYCNRGAKVGFESDSGIYIFNLEKQFTLESLRTLRETAYKTPQEFLAAFKTIIPHPELPVIVIQAKPQKRGNCSFANIKTLVEGLLFILHQERQKNSLQTCDASLKYAYQTYKRITAWMRTDELKRLIVDINTAKREEEKSYLKTLLSLLLLEHHSKPAELKRAYFVLKNLSDAQSMEVVSEMYAHASQLNKALDQDIFDALFRQISEENQKSPTRKNELSLRTTLFSKPKSSTTPQIQDKIQIANELEDFIKTFKKGKGVTAAIALKYKIENIQNKPDLANLVSSTLKLFDISKKKPRSTNYQLGLKLNELNRKLTPAMSATWRRG